MPSGTIFVSLNQGERATVHGSAWPGRGVQIFNLPYLPAGREVAELHSTVFPICGTTESQERTRPGLTHSLQPQFL